MPRIVHCVRHAGGQHNAGVEFHQIIDPELTPLGRHQCQNLRSTHFTDQSHISLVTASPLARTLETAFLTFEPALQNGRCRPTILALPDAQEVCDYPFNTGSDLAALESKCLTKRWPVDLSLVKDGWNLKSPRSRYFPASKKLQARARDCRRHIFQLMHELVHSGVEDPEIVLVTHGGFAHFFTEDWEDSSRLSGTGWSNTEVRSYVFETSTMPDEDGDVHLMRLRRAGRGVGRIIFNVLDVSRRNCSILVCKAGMTKAYKTLLS